MATYSRSLRLDDATLETVESRVAFFLDTNIWIKLADAKTPQAETIRKRLIAFVDAEKVFCPLAMPTIRELRKQKGGSITFCVESLQFTAQGPASHRAVLAGV